MTGIDSLLFEEGTSVEQVTLAIHAGRLIEFDDRALASRSDSGPARTAAAGAGTSSQPRRQAAVPSSSKEEEEERILRRRRQHFVVENLEALAFKDEASDAP